MNILSLLILSSLASNKQSTDHDDCFEWFKAENYEQVISYCKPSNSEYSQVAFIYFAAGLFSDISHSRINYIFYNGKKMGSFYHKHYTGKNLYTQLEKHHLNQYFPRLVEFANQGIPMAQMLTAKIFYINVEIIKMGEVKESSGEFQAEFDEGLNKYYIPNLKKILEVEPDNREVLALLGQESFDQEYVDGQFGSNIKYFRVVDEQLYAYMLKAHELGHPGFQEVIDGVQAWQTHLKGLEYDAKNQDPEAIFKLARTMHTKAHDEDHYYDEALKLYQQAADLGHAGALKALNGMYGSVRFNKAKYLKTLQLLIDIYDTHAMLRMGDIYLCNNRKAEAQKLYERAEKLNDPIARYALEDLKYDGVPSAGCGH